MALILAGLAGLILAGVAWYLAMWLPQLIQDAEAELRGEPVPSVPIGLCAMLAGRKGEALGLSLVMVAMSLGLVGHGGWSLRVALLLLLAAGLLSLALADWRTRLLPDALTQPLVWVGLIAQIFPPTRSIGTDSAILGAVAGYALPWSAGIIYVLAGRGEPIGGGDLKLIAVLGAWFGPLAALWSLVVACLGLIASHVASLALGKGGHPGMVAFGPWLALSGIGCIVVTA